MIKHTPKKPDERRANVSPLKSEKQKRKPSLDNYLKIKPSHKSPEKNAEASNKKLGEAKNFKAAEVVPTRGADKESNNLKLKEYEDNLKKIREQKLRMDEERVQIQKKREMLD